MNRPIPIASRGQKRSHILMQRSLRSAGQEIRGTKLFPIHAFIRHKVWILDGLFARVNFKVWTAAAAVARQRLEVILWDGGIGPSPSSSSFPKTTSHTLSYAKPCSEVGTKSRICKGAPPRGRISVGIFYSEGFYPLHIIP